MVGKAIVWILIIACWILGGQWKGRIRDIFCPILIGIGIWLATKSWLVSILSIGSFQIIRLGYGNYEPSEPLKKQSFLARLTKDRQGAIIRAIWGGFVGLISPICLVAMNYLSLPKYALFIGLNALIGYCVSKFRFNVILADICVAGGVGSILFLI